MYSKKGLLKTANGKNKKTPQRIRSPRGNEKAILYAC
jgi:hypothetical protein